MKKSQWLSLIVLLSSSLVCDSDHSGKQKEYSLWEVLLIGVIKSICVLLSQTTTALTLKRTSNKALTPVAPVHSRVWIATDSTY